jgi:hypothetical protein
MRIGLPLAALAYAGTDAARCDAAAQPYMPRVVLPPALPEHRLLMMRAVDALADELLTMLRALYLVRQFGNALDTCKPTDRRSLCRAVTHAKPFISYWCGRHVVHLEHTAGASSCG